MYPLNMECGFIGGFITPASSQIMRLSLPCLSELIRRFALYNLCDLNPTSWADSVAQLVERQHRKQEVVGLNPT